MNIFIAFVAGLASFLSPCVLPLVPSYLFQLVGPGILDSSEQAYLQANSASKAIAILPKKLSAFRHALLFVCGFSVAFIALGATASVLGEALHSNQQTVEKIGGAVLVILGLNYTGILSIPFLLTDKHIKWQPGKRTSYSSFLIGLIFAAGWTPCVGTVLAAILALAAQSATLTSGIALLTAYSLGLGIPFLLMGLAFSRARIVLNKIRPYTGVIERISGILIIAMGILIFNGWMLYLDRYFTAGSVTFW